MDRDLVEQARRGDREAFAVLVHQVSDSLYAVAYRILRDTGLAEDALQNALVIAWRRVPHLRESAGDRTDPGTRCKTTYSRVVPSLTFQAGWHYHNGPVIVSVTAGTLTFFDGACATWDLTAGHTYIESTGQVLNAKVLPAKNAGIATVEWFTTRLYPEGAGDPVEVAPPCTP